MKKAKPPLSLPTDDSITTFQELLEPIYSLDEKKLVNNNPVPKEEVTDSKPAGPPTNLPFG